MIDELIFKRGGSPKREFIGLIINTIGLWFITVLVVFLVILPTLVILDKTIVMIVSFIILLGASKILLKYVLNVPNYIKINKTNLEIKFTHKTESVPVENIYSYTIKNENVFFRYSKSLVINHKNGYIKLNELFFKQFKEICNLLKDLKKDKSPRLDICLKRKKLSDRVFFIGTVFLFFCLLSNLLNSIFNAKEIISAFNFLVFLLVIIEHYYSNPVSIKLDYNGIELISIFKPKIISFGQIKLFRQKKTIFGNFLEIFYDSKKIRIYKRHYEDIDNLFEVYKNLTFDKNKEEK